MRSLRVRATTCQDLLILTHSGRAMHICVGKLIIIGSYSCLPPARCQAITWTIDEILLIRPFGTNCSEILIGNKTFFFMKMHLNMFAKWRPFCLGLSVLRPLFNYRYSLYHRRHTFIMGIRMLCMILKRPSICPYSEYFKCPKLARRLLNECCWYVIHCIVCMDVVTYPCAYPGFANVRKHKFSSK